MEKPVNRPRGRARTRAPAPPRRKSVATRLFPATSVACNFPRARGPCQRCGSMTINVRLRVNIRRFRQTIQNNDDDDDDDDDDVYARDPRKARTVTRRACAHAPRACALRDPPREKSSRVASAEETPSAAGRSNALVSRVSYGFP